MSTLLVFAISGWIMFIVDCYMLLLLIPKIFRLITREPQESQRYSRGSFDSPSVLWCSIGKWDGEKWISTLQVEP